MDYQTFMQMIAEITENNDDDLSMDMILDDIEGWNAGVASSRNRLQGCSENTP